MAGGARRSAGQALAEFALIAPVFFLLLLGCIEFGRAVYTVQILNNATREGARYAIVHGAQAVCPSGRMPGGVANNCDPNGKRITTAVENAAFGLNPSALTVVVKWCHDVATCTTPPGNGTNGRNETVVVRATYAYRALIPLLPLPSFNVTGESTLVINH